MLRKSLFKKPTNELENYSRHAKVAVPLVPNEMCISCPSCKSTLYVSDLNDNCNICSSCGHHFRINARQRINMLFDEHTFTELYASLSSTNILDFPDYDKKLKNAALESAEKEAVICGEAKINDFDCAAFIMEPYFMMGSMGNIVGEKITQLFEYAAEKNLPVVGCTVSGGARMQEGILSLMQMAKISGAVKRHSDQGNLYITILTDPTTGGVVASFAMQGDIILAEPGALIGFAGPRVIEQTIRQKLPSGFQKSEFLLQKGFVDALVDRRDQKMYIANLLSLHSREAANGCI